MCYLGGSCSGNAFLLSSDGQPHCTLHAHPQLLLLAALLTDAGADVTRDCPGTWQKPDAGSPAKDNQSPGASLVPIPAGSLAANISSPPSTQTHSLLQCAELRRGRNGALIHLLGVKLQPSFSLGCPSSPFACVLPVCGAAAREGHFWGEVFPP